jgi:hypothetical protein
MHAEAGDGWTAELRVRLPPAQLSDFIGFVAHRGELQQREVHAKDVSRELFDRALALKNLAVTQARLEALIAQGDLKMAEVLEVERELSRLRGEIERLEGEERFLEDQVAYATVSIRLDSTTHEALDVLSAEPKLHTGPRFSLLKLLDNRPDQHRAGVGFTLFGSRAFSADIDLLPARGTEGVTVLATVGGATYSDFLGHGGRRFGNPYLGLRVGFAELDHAPMLALGAEGGVEIFKNRYVLFDVFVRPMGFIGQTDATLGVHSGLDVILSF